MSNVGKDEGIQEELVETLSDKANDRPRRTRVLTEKGAVYRIERLRNEYSSKRRAWRKQISKSGSILADENDIAVLQNERSQVEAQMESLITAYNALRTEVQIDELRELLEIQERLEEETKQLVRQFNDRILELRRTQSDAVSSRSKSTKKSRLKSKAEARTASSRSRASSSKQNEMAAKEARLKMELKFIDLETQKESELRRIKIAKELAVTKAEVDAINNGKSMDNMSCNTTKRDPKLPQDDISEDLLNYYLQSQVDLLQTSFPPDLSLNISDIENHTKVPGTETCDPEALNAEPRAMEANRIQHSTQVRSISSPPILDLNPAATPFTSHNEVRQSQDPLQTRESTTRVAEGLPSGTPLHADTNEVALSSMYRQRQQREHSPRVQSVPTMTESYDPIRRLDRKSVV